ncbi:TIM-barrel domain-containing protein [Novosphingobium sp. 9]|uniref:TIM-barrel domain-containing protein n=1 Tax=Novosphingobium sp. 9 TaxID=2025349 RepID=UPI0021B54709|nr:TIM-barrel domain-containing protein [Novosphingobium sp. 9]
MKHIAIAALMAGSALTATPVLAAPAGVSKVPGGVVVTPASGPSDRVEVTLHGDGIFHVVAHPRGLSVPEQNASLMAPNPPQAGAYTVSEAAGSVTIRAVRASAVIDKKTGQVRFLDAAGKPMLAESAPTAFTATKADGTPYVTVSQQFNRGTDEGLYGLGQHQQAVMDYNGQDVQLAQHNMDIGLPFLVSTRNYGLLWDNESITRFGNPAPYKLVGDTGGMTVTSGGKPGFTAQYFLDGKEVVNRQEATIDYQFLDDQAKWPEAAKARTEASSQGQNTAGNAVQTQAVVWNGDLQPDKTGVHKFQLYGSSYYKVYVDGKLVLDRWRQNWNPWYADFDVPMVAGKPVHLKIEWDPNAGYMALLHNDPLPEADRHSVWFTSDVARDKDYWFVAAKDMDGVVAGYRQLTGKAEMMPKWVYGFWQSRQRYDTQAELLNVVSEYRKRDYPLDNIVLDWRYWKDDSWGSHEFDKSRFPDAAAMVKQVHDEHAEIMISVWPKFYPTTDNFKELDAAGAIFHGNLRQGNKDWVGEGFLNTFYDPYSAKGREIFWKQIEDRLGKKGFDAWWADASEPDMHSNLSITKRIDTMGPTAIGPAAEFFNSFPLENARAFYEGWSRFKPDVRPFLLTRSGFGGLQRYGAAVWSGDVATRWYDLHAQISAGVNTAMSGLPNWTHDIGGFSVEPRFAEATPKPEDLAEWRELNLRWFQFGAFSPIFRSHGEQPWREIYEIAPEGSPMRASMVWYDKLRYRLMPYIYTLGADAYEKDGSIMRGLVMDFPQDARARTINDEYLFGKAFLVAPVSTYKARERSVWLPGKGVTWYDFESGKTYAGGQDVTVAAPAERMPLFVRAGSIVPMGPVMQYTDEKPEAPVTLVVYTGASGATSLYEDDGRSEGYKSGAFSRMPIVYDDATGTVTLGARLGKGYAGMPATRTVRVKWLRPGQSVAEETSFDTEAVWNGQSLTIRRPAK